jgi:hypothetical protein
MIPDGCLFMNLRTNNNRVPGKLPVTCIFLINHSLKMQRGEGFTMQFGGYEVPAGETVKFREHGLDRKTVTFYQSSIFKNLSAGAGGHPGSETVFSDSFDFFRLIGVFHGHGNIIQYILDLDSLWITDI